MADEVNPDHINEKQTFISPLNEDKSSFEHSDSSYQHIEETHPTAFSTEENNNHSHIQLIENGDHHENSSNIEPVEPTENHSTETEFIQETTTVDQPPSSPSHIQSINISDQHSNEQDSFQSNQSSFEQNNTFNIDDQSNITNNQDDSNLLLIHNDTTNNDTSFQTQTDLHDKPEQLKTQHELDEDEIPPAEVPVDVTPINPERKNSSSELLTNITDDRPLTELETPYEHHQENENRSVEYSLNETNENGTNNVSLPDLVSETFEQNSGDYIREPIESEKALVEENLVQPEFRLIQDDFPPLPQTLAPVDQIFHREDFSPLTSTLNTHEQHPLLSSVSLKSEDVLGNQTLLRQTIVEGTRDTHPTRSTMVTISYTLSLVDNNTSNVRVIENISNERFFLSEGDLIPAIDICIQLMDRGERILIDSDIRHCYGDIGCEDKYIPPITSLNPYRMKIDLELHDWISPPDVRKLSIEDRLYWGDKKRHMGNFYYRRQDYKTSLQSYHGALRFLSTDDNPILISVDESQRSILNDRFIQVQNNVAQVNLLLNNYEACLNAVENVLKYDSKNVKALFRQGKALFELGKYDQAIQPLKLFTQIQKGNSNSGIDNEKAKEMISISENKLASYQKNEKEIYRRMFQPTTTTTTNQQHQTKNTNQTDNANNNWWPYIALGSAVLATIGLVTFIKYRKVL